MPKPRHSTTAGLLLVASLSISGSAAAQGAADRPPLPSWSVPGEDGALAVWSNPANLAFDPDSSFALLYTQNLDGQNGRFGAATNFGPLGTGLSYNSGGALPAWWTLTTGLGLKLDSRLALGANLGWQLPEGSDNNFATWDLAIGWRPESWLGLSAVGRNLGNPAPEYGVTDTYIGGVALRPWGGIAMLGGEATVSGVADEDPEVAFGGTLRLEPWRGVVVRFSGDQELNLGAGLEVYFGRNGVGGHVAAASGSAIPAAATIYALSSQTGDRAFGGGHKVPEFVFNGPFPYQPSPGFLAPAQESYIHLLERLDRAAKDPAVKGMVLHLDQVQLSFAQVAEIRDLIRLARDQGKTVVAYIDRESSNGAYTMAAAADRVWIHPAGELGLVGLSSEAQYLRGALDMIGIEPQAIKRAEYKSSPEMFTNTEGTVAGREQMNALLDDLSGWMVTEIASSRGRTPEQVRNLIDGGPYSAAEAIEKGLVDDSCYPDEVEGKLAELLSGGIELTEDYGLEGRTSGWRAPREIAVVYVEGAIVSGSSAAPGLLSGGRMAGSDTIVRQLHQARRDQSVKGVVLRVDSPGGSAFASDEIWRAVAQVREAGKPVVVSMGGVAASGGYYVAAGATAIYAEPTTITGSIGVYSTHFSAQELLDRVGVTTELYRRGRNSAMYSITKKLDPEEYAATDRLVAQTYVMFKERVGSGRRMEAEAVETVARGRVWSGTAAMSNGLVDGLGGFHDAVERTRVEAGIRPGAAVELITYSGRLGSDGEVARSQVRALVAELAPPRRVPTALSAELLLLDQWLALSDSNVLALMPYSLDIH
jgi:protease IV